MFRRLIFSAVFVGIFSGLIFSAAQHFTVTPILLSAELFEQADAAPVHQHGEMAAGMDMSAAEPEEWGPSDGLERSSYTAGANILAGIGFASLFLVVMSQLVLRQKIQLSQLSLKEGVMGGLLAYAIFFAIPSLGLPPEIPGSSADLLKNRQSWWLLSVTASGLGLMLMIFAPLKYKALGIVSGLVPFIVGAPHYDGAMFTHPDPAAVASLDALHQQFLVATGLSNLLFWLVLGAGCALLLKGWIYRQPLTSSAAN